MLLIPSLLSPLYVLAKLQTFFERPLLTLGQCRIHCSYLLEHDVHRKTIDYNVMSSENQVVPILVRLQDIRLEQRASRQIERLLPRFFQPRGYLGFTIFRAGKIDQRDLQTPFPHHFLHRFLLDNSPQRIMSGGHLPNCPSHLFRMEMAVQLQRDIDTVSRGASRRYLIESPQLSLRFSERKSRIPFPIRLLFLFGVGMVGYKTSLNHLLNARLDCADDKIDVLFRMCGGQEVVAPFPDKNPLFHQVIEQQFEVAGKGEAEQRAEVHDFDGDSVFAEIGVQRFRQPFRLLVQPLLQSRSLFFEISECGQRRRHRQRVLAESAAETDPLGLRIRRIAVLPCSAIDRFHIGRLSGDHADRHPSADELAVRRDIRFHPEPGLSPPRMDAKPGNHLVEDQQRLGLLGDPAQPLQKFPGLQLGATALHWFHHHRRQLVGVRLDILETLLTVVFQNPQILHRSRRNSTAYGKRFQTVLLPLRPGGRAIGVTVVRIFEDDDLAAPGGRPCKAHSRHDRFRAGIGEGHPVESGKFGDQPGGFARMRRTRSQLSDIGRFGGQGFLYERGMVAEQSNPLPHRYIDVLVVVDVPDAGAHGPFADDGIEHLLGGEAEADGGAAIGQNGAVFFGQYFGRSGAFRVAFYQGFQMALLLWRQSPAPNLQRR